MKKGTTHMRKKYNNKKTETPGPLPRQETVAGLVISPETDIPFGKQLHIGLYEYTIYERATEQGYYAGIAHHFNFLHDQGSETPVMLDDEGFARVLDAFTPKDLPAHDRSMWRSHFIAGWSAVFLGLVRTVQDGEALPGQET
jgi:hypothetical protein